MTLDTIDQTEKRIRDSLLEKLDREKGKQDSSRSAILVRILNFRNEFQEVTAEMGTSLEALGEYLKLKRLVKRFKEEERWSNKVTDVRNWLDFSVSERYQTDDVEKEHHTDSSGKSGGQKAKLAYTILASAIAYQFGLDQNNVKAKSFRFVVIDEAFSKSDDDNARYAMELFRNLDLQLLVVTPKDKINVIEGHIANLHFVANTPEGNYSSIATISIDEYRQNQQRVLNQSYDYALRD